MAGNVVDGPLSRPASDIRLVAQPDDGSVVDAEQLQRQNPEHGDQVGAHVEDVLFSYLMLFMTDVC